MGESGKSVLALGVIVGILGTFIAWGLDGTPPAARYGFPAAGLAALGVLLWALFRKDRAPDFLRRFSRTYFERDGFCFAIAPVVEGGDAGSTSTSRTVASGPASRES